jgi:hypothetical protein
MPIKSYWQSVTFWEPIDLPHLVAVPAGTDDVRVDMALYNPKECCMPAEMTSVYIQVVVYYIILKGDDAQ